MNLQQTAAAKEQKHACIQKKNVLICMGICKREINLLTLEMEMEMYLYVK